MAATSGSNAWVLAGRGIDEVDYTDALHLTGNSWDAPVRLDAAIRTAVAPSPSQLWAFGEPSSSGPLGYFAHFNGGSWTHGSFPFSGTATAARFRRRRVGWRAAATARPRWASSTGTGTGGSATPLPDLGLPASDLRWASVNGLADVGPRDVWADITHR